MVVDKLFEFIEDIERFCVNHRWSRFFNDWETGDEALDEYAMIYKNCCNDVDEEKDAANDIFTELTEYMDCLYNYIDVDCVKVLDDEKQNARKWLDKVEKVIGSCVFSLKGNDLKGFLIKGYQMCHLIKEAAVKTPDEYYGGRRTDVMPYYIGESTMNKELFNNILNEGSAFGGDISDIPNKFQMGSYLSVDLDPEEIMSLGIGQRDIRDETTGKPYGEVSLDESKAALFDSILNEAVNPRFVIRATFDCNGVEKKAYYNSMLDNWVSECFPKGQEFGATQFKNEPSEEKLEYVKTVMKEGTKETLGCDDPQLVKLEVLTFLITKRSCKLVDKKAWLGEELENLLEAVEDFPRNTRAMYRFARRRHNDTGAVRKVSGQPYWVHPEGVAKIVMDHGGSDIEIKAAMAHDVLEDTGESYEDMVEKFGDKVASIVKEVTNDKFEITRIGKEKYISEELCRLSPEALTVKLADMLYNMKDSPTESNYERMRKNIAFLMMNRQLDGIHLALAEEILEV